MLKEKNMSQNNFALFVENLPSHTNKEALKSFLEKRIARQYVI